MRRAAWLTALFAALLVAPLLSGSAYAVQPDEMLKNPALEQQAREISAELRCLVCQNQSIDDSDAPLAHDLRVIVRERLQAGDGHKDVIDYVVARYGEFILLRPRFSAKTYLLWVAPLLLLGSGLFLAFRLFWGGGPAVEQAPEGLSDIEQAKLRDILEHSPN